MKTDLGRFGGRPGDRDLRVEHFGVEQKRNEFPGRRLKLCSILPLL